MPRAAWRNRLLFGRQWFADAGHQAMACRAAARGASGGAGNSGEIGTMPYKGGDLDLRSAGPTFGEPWGATGGRARSDRRRRAGAGVLQPRLRGGALPWLGRRAARPSPARPDACARRGPGPGRARHPRRRPAPGDGGGDCRRHAGWPGRSRQRSACFRRLVGRAAPRRRCGAGAASAGLPPRPPARVAGRRTRLARGPPVDARRGRSATPGALARRATPRRLRSRRLVRTETARPPRPTPCSIALPSWRLRCARCARTWPPTARPPAISCAPCKRSC